MNDWQDINRTSIDGVYLAPLKIINANGGPVMHMLRRGSPFLPENLRDFGEIYFSQINPGYIKAWKRHTLQTQNFAVPQGLIKIYLYDDRKDSKTWGQTEGFTLGRPDNYNLLHIPPGVWYGFIALNNVPAIICNYADVPHDPQEAEKVLPGSPDAPCPWPPFS